MTTIYILVKERYAFGLKNIYIMDVEKDWDKIYNIRKKLIQTITEDGDPFFEEKFEHGYDISELEVIEYSDFIHQVRLKNNASVVINFNIIKRQLED